MFEGRNTLLDRLIDTFDRNKRSPKVIGEILTSYVDAVDALGSPNQQGLFAAPRPSTAPPIRRAETPPRTPRKRRHRYSRTSQIQGPTWSQMGSKTLGGQYLCFQRGVL